MAVAFFTRMCAFCRQPVELTDDKSFLVVSDCHPNPGQAEWDEAKRRLRIGRLEAIAGNGKARLYLLHQNCIDIIKDPATKCKSYFDCVQALEPILHDGKPAAPPTNRDWPWSQSSIDYAPALRAIITGFDVNFNMLLRKVSTRLGAILFIKLRLPVEVVDMILNYLPLELALALSHLSGILREACLQRLRRDPIAIRLELAYDALRLKKGGRICRKYTREIRLEPKMIVQFEKYGGKYFLQDLRQCSNADATEVFAKGQILFEHNRHRNPYIAVQVNEFGITHVAFESDAEGPKWISPNLATNHPVFFQDSSSIQQYSSVIVVSNGLKFCSVDIPHQCPYSRSRALLPHMPGRLPVSWSLSRDYSIYVRPIIIDVTRAKVPHVFEAGRPRPRGFHSNTKRTVLRELNFPSEGVVRTAELVHHISKPDSTYVRFPEENHPAPVSADPGNVKVTVPNVVAIWQALYACNLIVESSEDVQCNKFMNHNGIFLIMNETAIFCEESICPEIEK